MHEYMPIPSTRSETLIKKLEILARKNPQAYRIQISILIGLGYCYLALPAVLLCLYVYHWYTIFNSFGRPISNLIVFTLLPTIHFLALIIVCFLSISLFNIFFNKIPPPHGVILDLKKRDNSQIRDILQDISKKVGSVEIDSVVMTADVNAAVIQVPKFGIFGKKQNFLILGLPLMLSLSSEQFKAVLAHEFAHLSTNELSLNNWLYRLVTTYKYLQENALKDNKIDLYVWLFLRWYVPLLDVHSFVLRRINEYEADRLAANITGTKNFANALMSIEIVQHYLNEKFWPSIYKDRGMQPEPPANIFELMGKSIATECDPIDIQRWLKYSLNKQTNLSDTHPCLADRLLALGYRYGEAQDLDSCLKFHDSSARRCLGNSYYYILSQFNRIWVQSELYNWELNYASLQKSQQSVNRLVEKSENDSLTVDELWRLATRKLEIGDYDSAIIIFYQILERNPNHAKTNLSLGTILLDTNNTDGINYLERAMQLDPGTISEAITILNHFGDRVPDVAESDRYKNLISDYYIHGVNSLSKAYNKLISRDLNNKHQLHRDVIELITTSLIDVPEIQHLYAVRKLRSDDLLEHLILVTYSFKDRLKLVDDEDIEKMYIALERAIEPLGLVTIHLFRQDGYYECDPVIEKLRSIPGTCIYNRKKTLAIMAQRNEREH
jgi:Zn-dependent protease with chaperone function